MSGERRTYDREYPRRLVAKVETANGQWSLRILDESAGGIGLFASGPVPLFADQDAVVTIEGQAPRKGSVCYVRPFPSGGYQVGIVWKSSADPK